MSLRQKTENLTLQSITLEQSFNDVVSSFKKTLLWY